MENIASQTLSVNLNKQYLSSQSSIFKVERFLMQTKKLISIDDFILKIGEALQTKLNDFKNMFLRTKCNSFKIQTFDKKFCFYVKFGFQNIKNISPFDIVFFASNFDGEKIKNHDSRIISYQKNINSFNIVATCDSKNISEDNLKKLYYVSFAKYVNLPLLNKEQQEIVNIENENVLVQGVAGSGKTNICTSKIIFVASKNYGGKILYTTFSRALLLDTKNKIELYKKSLIDFVNDYENNKIVYLDKEHKKAIEKRLGLTLVDNNEKSIISQIKSIIEYLDSKVDYLLLEDLYKKITNEDIEITTSETFEKDFLPNISNHNLLNRMKKISKISNALLYKEIYGMIFGWCDENNPNEILSLEKYISLRENSFTREECEIIYLLAKEYEKYLSKSALDNNIISRKLLLMVNKIPKYSLSIIDEVQDFTQINLYLLKKISIKMFCVGDALQMINPSYFNFAYLKRLMYEKDLLNVKTLKANYRNNKKIVDLLDELGQINIEQFGLHNFVIKNESVDEDDFTKLVCTFDRHFIDKLKNQKFENFTILVNSNEQKEEVKKIFKKQEVLTISEIKGLERDTVLLWNLISNNSGKWKYLENLKLNHKKADENSVYRYYFNLFYVGLSRAKHNLFVFENENVKVFDNFFKRNFEILNGEKTFEEFTKIISKVELEQDEIIDRIYEFIKLGQFENAKFYAEKLQDEQILNEQLARIEIYKEYVFKQKPREAGIKFWQAGLFEEARQQFLISNDQKLLEFLENMQYKSEKLDASVVSYYNDFIDNPEVCRLIIDLVKGELETQKEIIKINRENLKKIKGNKKWKTNN